MVDAADTAIARGNLTHSLAFISVPAAGAPAAADAAAPAADVLPNPAPNLTPAVTTVTSGRTAGGLFAQPTNIGHYTRDVFAVVPEGNVQLGYQLTDRLRATVGYTFFYMSDVVRPGDQIDRTINPALLALPPAAGGPARPAFQVRQSDFWAQGIDFGLEFLY